MFKKRTEKELTAGAYNPARRPGTYIVRVDEALDSNVVFPEVAQEGKSRFISPTVTILGLVKDDGETHEDFRDREDQIGKNARPRIYLSELTVETSMQLLTEIAGSAELPEDFAKEVTTGGTKDEPEYDLKIMADHAPINPANLVGRLFRAVLELPRGKGKGGLGINQYRSWMVPESEQTVPPRNLFEGKDEMSYAIKERLEKGRKDHAETNRSSRTSGMDVQFDDDSGDDDGEMPY